MCPYFLLVPRIFEVTLKVYFLTSCRAQHKWSFHVPADLRAFVRMPSQGMNLLLSVILAKNFYTEPCQFNIFTTYGRFSFRTSRTNCYPFNIYLEPHYYDSLYYTKIDAVGK